MFRRFRWQVPAGASILTDTELNQRVIGISYRIGETDVITVIEISGCRPAPSPSWSGMQSAALNRASSATRSRA